MKNNFPLTLRKRKETQEGVKLLGKVHINRSRRAQFQTKTFQFSFVFFLMFYHVIQDRKLFKPLSAFDTDPS